MFLPKWTDEKLPKCLESLGFFTLLEKNKFSEKLIEPYSHKGLKRF